MRSDGKHAVLVGENDGEVSGALARILVSQGLMVYTASTADEFLSLLTEHQQLIDVCIYGELARKRGGLLLSRVKDIDMKTKIIVVSDKGNEMVDIVDILRYGADEFIEKPVSPAALATRAMELLRGKV